MWPRSASTTWWPFGRCGSSSRVAFCGGVAKSRVPPISSVSTFESCTRRVLVLVRARRPGVEQAAAGPDEVGAGVADDRAAVGVRARRSAVASAASLAADRGDVAPDLTRAGRRAAPSATGASAPLASPSAAESSVSIVIGAGERAAAVGGRVHQAEERGDPDVALLDRQEPPAVGRCADGGLQRRGEVRRPAPAAASCAHRARRSGRSARRSSSASQRKWPGGLTPIITERWMLRRVAPGVDHRRARAGALAEQVDRVVAERAARGVEVVDALRQRVAGEVDAVALRAGPRRPGTPRRRRGTTLAEEVARVLAAPTSTSRAVEPRRAVDAAVADEHDVVPVGEAARVRELHVREARAALEAEDRRARVRRARTDAGHRQRDQPRVRVVPVLAARRACRSRRGSCRCSVA